MPNPLSYDAEILIVGGGTWGTAISYRLAKRGFRKITILEAEENPSPIAAGNDINKIMEEPISPPSDQDSDLEYTWNLIETLATEVWRTDTIYKPHYHETGFIYAAVGDAAYAKVVDSVNGAEHVYEPVNAFKDTMPGGVLTRDFPGWVAAKKTVEAVFKESQRMGVKSLTGHQGKVEILIFNDSNTDITGAETADGTSHYADCVILAAGANSDFLLDFEKQLRPTAWTLAHIPLTDDEAKVYRNLPVLYGVDRGFFIEPNPDGRELKICDEHPGYINLIHDLQQIPVESEQRIRELLKETMPQLAEMEFSFARICWDADTADRLFLIDRHPQYHSLVLAVGGSGHGFMCSLAVGILVANLLEDTLDRRAKDVLRWRPEAAVNRDWWATQGRFGAEDVVMDFQAVIRWTDIKAL
ncbi:fructosyl amine:oxygen oxidoreductase [Tothia fuscella]|uniref:Fructosyl amine:oxygen oxidoreductase n=1 Tax=Tothia fuscella TaxID=1048955 RepID=A0A9P4TT83_9PEZI|nr:fructosyl amine:oxygen oxidoreductase [Tothia fuscella]